MAEHDREILLYLLGLLATRPVFPKLYDGFREIDEIAKGEDAMLGIMQDCTRLISSDKLISLANESKLSEWENELGLSGNGMTLDERRAQMVSFLGRSRVINDAVLVDIARYASGNDDIEVLADCDALKCSITKTDTEDPDEAVEIQNAYVAIRPKIPQNLKLISAVCATVDKTFIANHGYCSTIYSHLGYIVTPEPPEPPEPPVPTIIGMEYGLMGASGDSETGTMEQGTTGFPSLIHGNLIDAGIGEYGVM